ncbi:ComEC/Rec2 family competence protein [Tessaracoccus sp. G1721]
MTEVGREKAALPGAGHDWRMVPVAAAAWAASWIGTSGWRPDAGPLIAIVVGLGLIALVAARLGRMWTCLVLVVFAVTGLTAGVQSWQRHTSTVSEWASAGAVGTVRVRIQGEPQVTSGIVVARAGLVWVEARGQRIEAAVPVVLLGTGDTGEAMREAVAGAEYVAGVRLRAPRPDEGVAAVLSVRQFGELARGPSVVDAGAGAMRQGLRAAVAHSPPSQAALVPSLVVGDTSRVDDEMKRRFQATGLTHLMAVSGANLTLMLGVILTVARSVGLRGWSVRAAAIVGVAVFVAVCGQEPSVLRATAMGLVALAAVGVSAGHRSVRALSVAVLALTWLDPWLARSVGFALSVTACVGIVLLGPPLVRAMARWMPRWAAEAVAVPLAAQLATQPLVTRISDQVSVVGVLTNALAGPFVGPTTVLGLAAALLWWVPALAAGPGWLAGWCSQPILWLAEAGAALPSATWDWEASTSGMAVVVVAVAAAAMVLPSILRSPLGGAALLVVVIAATLVRPIPLGWPGPWAAAFCDVGQGDSTVLAAGQGAAVLVDAGPEAAPTEECLTSLGVTSVPLLILTHWHADHTGGAAEIIARYRPQLILTRAGTHPPWLLDAARAVAAEVRRAEPGQQLTVGEVRWRTASVWEPAGGGVPEAEGEGSPENDASVVGVAEVRGLRVLLAGDAEPAGQSVALRAAEVHGVSLNAHVLKLPHHGSSRQEPRFFAASGAALAVASSGLDNDYGHPAPSTVQLAQRLGMEVVRTDQHGSIAVELAGERLRVRTWRSG